MQSLQNRWIMMKSQSCWKDKEKFRKNLKQWAAGILMHDLKWQWMLCAVRHRILCAKFFRAASEDALHFAGCFFKNRIYFCSMNQQTILMQKLLRGYSRI